MWFTSFTIFNVHKESLHFISVVDTSALHVNVVDISALHLQL